MKHLILNLLLHLTYKLIQLLGGNEMVTVYATLIIAGRKQFSQVPVSLQPAVREELLAMGLDENGFPIEEPVTEPTV